MYKFEIKSSKKFWEYDKSGLMIRYEEVPNTAKGFERCRCNMISDELNSSWFISANTEKHYYVRYQGDKWFSGIKIVQPYEPISPVSLWLEVENDTVTIKEADQGKRHYKDGRFLKRFKTIADIAAQAIIFDNAVEFIPYRG